MNYRPRHAWLVIVAVAAACADTPTAPSAPSATARGPQSGPHLTVGTTPIATFVLDPRVDNVFVSREGHRLSVPANSICQPGISGYGAAYWDQGCSAATLPITFTVYSSQNSDGTARIDIDPDVRFSPAKVATVTLRDSAAAAAGNPILYCNATGCVDEGKDDPSLATTTDPTGGTSSRRVKHFSGYSNGWGFANSAGMSMFRAHVDALHRAASGH